MIITDLEGRNLYRNRNDFEPDLIINTIVKAGGIENIDLTFYADDFYDEEAIKAIRFLKSINYDINKLPIEQYREDVAIELIKQGYDMYKIRKDNVPVITECSYGVFKECIKNGLDLNRFNEANHFSSFIDYDDTGNPHKIYNYEISSFIRNANIPDFIDSNKLELIIDNGLLNEKIIKDLEGGFGPLYYQFSLGYHERVFIKTLDAYDSLEINDNNIFKLDNMNENLKAHFFKRYLEINKDKNGAINHILEIFDRNGHNIESEEHSATLEVIKNHIKMEQNEIQEVFTHTAPKPSTRRRM
ncbi:hypothetical protein JK271_004343 [Escherichia coli]|nr:hypothetical protein [Escherichia coli]EHA4825373.1 hypothetical protein [Escherichia coli]EHK4232578.1 hypothetical protein [Escherichia coli]